jgi:hypothetical protein
VVLLLPLETAMLRLHDLGRGLDLGLCCAPDLDPGCSELILSASPQ